MAKECKENKIEREFVRQMEVWSKTGDHPQMVGFALSANGKPNIVFGVENGKLAIKGMNY